MAAEFEGRLNPNWGEVLHSPAHESTLEKEVSGGQYAELTKLLEERIGQEVYFPNRVGDLGTTKLVEVIATESGPVLRIDSRDHPSEEQMVGRYPLEWLIPFSASGGIGFYAKPDELRSLREASSK